MHTTYIMLYILLSVNIPTLQDNYLQQAGHLHTVVTNEKLVEVQSAGHGQWCNIRNVVLSYTLKLTCWIPTKICEKCHTSCCRMTRTAIKYYLWLPQMIVEFMAS